MRTLRIFTLCLTVAACGGTVDPDAACRAFCAGCCREGVCQPGETVEACGRGGLSCDTCVSGQSCSSAGRCVTETGSGGGGEAGGAGGGGGVAGGAGGAAGGGMSCTPETNAELCTLASRTCGPLMRVDRCGQSRTVSCGSCAQNEACTSAGACVCQPESTAQLCQRKGATCGTLSTTDNCGAARTVSCGTCTGTTTCGGGGAANTCGCTAETDAQFCTRLGRSCGAATGNDNCGRPRSITSCGSCVAPNTCNASGACTCPAETNAQFCTRLGARCGALSGTDACGQLRNVASCGTCSGTQTCAGGGQANQCGCTAQSDAELCAARGKDCGSLSLTDNCGATRTVSCGSCGGLQTCGGGGTTNVCGCTAETNPAFCSRVGAQCGAVTAADNCGTSRTVASCGSCTAPQTCSASNQCACVPESDAQLCGRLGKTCGALTATDNCGASRSVASCGACGAGSSCGAATNVCVANTPLPASGVCTTDGFCWAMPSYSYDGLNDVWVEPSGVVWAVGGYGTVLRWDGTSVRGFRHLSANGFTAVWASGSGEVWAGGTNGLVMRFDGTTWEDLSVGGTKTVNTIWGDGLGRVYVGGDDNLVRRFSNGVWSTPFSMGSSGADVDDLVGWGNGLRIISTYGQYEWDGVSSTVTAVDSVTGWCSYTAQVVVGPQEGWAARYCWSSGSTSDWQEAYKTIGTAKAWATLPTNTKNGTAYFAARGPNDVWLFGGGNRGWRFDGNAWSSATIANGVTFNAGHGSPARAAFVGSWGAVYGNSGSGWVSATPDAGWPAGQAAPNEQRVVPISDSRAVVYLAQSTSRTLSIWDNGSWLGTTSVPYRVTAATSPDGVNAFAVVSSPPLLYRFSGTTWSSVALPASTTEYVSVAATSTSDVWVSGWGKMVHYDGVTMSEVPTPFSGTSTKLSGLVAVSPTLAFVRASTGQLLRWSGSTWSLDATVGASVADYPLLKTSSGAVWAVASDGPRRFASGAWSLQPLPAGYLLGEQLWGSSDTDVTVSTTNGSTCTVSGVSWTCAPAPPGLFADQRVVKTGARTWIVSELFDGSGALRVMVLRK